MGINAGVSAVTGVYLGDQLLTKGGEVTIKTFAEMAPGPSELKGGDWDCGYFGVPTTAEMGIITGTGTGADGQPITATSLATAFNVAEGMMINSDIIWHKFVFKGEIIYIPQKTIRESISFNELAKKSLVYGAQVLKTDLAKFKVTLLKGFHSDIYGAPYSNGSSSKDYGELSEYDMLLRGISTKPYKTDFGLKIPEADLEMPWRGGGKGCWVKEIGYQHITNPDTRVQYETKQSTRYTDYSYSAGLSVKSSSYAWRPALRFTL